MTEDELDAVYNSPDGKMYISDTRREMLEVVFRSHKNESVDILLSLIHI